MAIETVREEVARLVDTDSGGRQHWLDSAADRLQGLVRNLVQQGGDQARQIKDLLHGKWLGHPLHAALTDVPIGAWTLGMLLDLVGARRTADTVIALGIGAAVPTALAGAADWSETGGKQRRVGLIHATLNTAALGCYIWSMFARRSRARAVGVALSTTGFGIASVSAWLGGKLVYDQGTGVSRNAWTPELSTFQVAARADNLAEGKLARAEITVGGTKVPLVLLKKGRQVLALSGVCNHWGGPLAEGKLVDGECVECPWHGSTFSLHDGSVVHGPATMPQPHFETRVRNGNVEVRRVQ
jgi:nitrite reductase/ring-hydroxylating ferredoxin subunit/uncharacterized membrane protein